MTRDEAEAITKAVTDGFELVPRITPEGVLLLQLFTILASTLKGLHAVLGASGHDDLAGDIFAAGAALSTKLLEYQEQLAHEERAAAMRNRRRQGRGRRT